jgi:hypothetical protein
MAIALSRTQNVGEAHAASNGQEELLVGEVPEERLHDDHRLTGKNPQCERSQDEGQSYLAAAEDRNDRDEKHEQGK